MNKILIVLSRLLNSDKDKALRSKFRRIEIIKSPFFPIELELDMSNPNDGEENKENPNNYTKTQEQII